jgi:uncharacterized protein YjiS (DUF1127 family)
MRTIDTIAARRPRARALGIAAILTEAIAWFDERLERRASRRALTELTEYQLKDIGISRADAVREAGRPFWD